MNPITIPNITIPVIGLPTIGIPSVGFPSASGGGLVWPKDLKESIKAIYDPAKQGMTNYDVIESYATNFKVWSKTTGITHVNEYIMSFIDVPIKGYVLRVDDFVPFSILVSGLTNGEIIATTYTNNNGEYTTITITKNGVYSYPVDSTRIIFNCITAIQNATITQLPTSILKDLSGNGNHAYLYGGKGKLNSGIGLYTYDYNSDRWSSTGRADYIITKKGFEFTNIIEDGGIIFALGSNIAKEGDKVKVKISGIPNGGRVYFGTWITATEDGEYLGTYAYDNNGNTTIGTLGCIGATITLEFIPDYPNQLCYDGKMYAVCYDFPILTDYTVMADRTWFDKTGVRCFCSKYKDNTVAALFKFEWVAGNKEYTSSLGKDTNVVFVDSNITWQTKTSYNGKALTNLQYEDGEHLIIGNRYEGDYSTYIGCHGTIIVANRSFTEGEITWLKDNWKKI